MVDEEKKEEENINLPDENHLKKELSLPALFEEGTRDQSVLMFDSIAPVIPKRTKS